MAAPVIEKKRFFCREWAFTKLSHCLEQRPASKTCGVLVVGGPGSGKTAFSAELAWPSAGANARHQRSLNRRLLARHFCQARSEASLSPAQFVRSLVAQLLQPGSDGIHRLVVSRDYVKIFKLARPCHVNPIPLAFIQNEMNEVTSSTSKSRVQMI